MTKKVDPYGNQVVISYDANFRLSTVTDSLNQVSTVTHLSDTPGNPGFYKIASISDPFGRSFSCQYDSTATNLIAITDVIGLKSAFAYDSDSSFINLMSTPYGDTAFHQYVPGIDVFPAKGLRALLPDGSQMVLENWINEPKFTFFWDRHQIKQFPSDPANRVYTHCKVTRWTVQTADGAEGPTIQNEKMPEEASTTFFTYGGGSNNTQPSDRPQTITRRCGNQMVNAILGGTPTPGDILRLNVVTGLTPAAYTVVAGDDLPKIAIGLAASVNANAMFQARFVRAAAAGNMVTLSDRHHTDNFNHYSFTLSPGATETLKLQSQVVQTRTVTITGLSPVGQQIQFNVQLPALPPYNNGQRTIVHVVQAGDTFETVAQALASGINADATLQTLPVTATTSGAQMFLSSLSPDIQTYSVGGFIGNNPFSTPRNGSTQFSEFQWNVIGNLLQSIDPLRRRNSYTYAPNNIDLLEKRETTDGDNFLIGRWDNYVNHLPGLYIDGSGRQTLYVWNPAGQLLTITDANGNTTTMTYSLDGYLMQIDGPLPGNQDVKKFSYDGFGRLFSTEDSVGYQLFFLYDNANRLVKTLFLDGSSEDTIYNRLDAVLSKDRNGRWTERRYDSLDQLISEVDPLGRKVQYKWCDCGSLSELIDPAGNVTAWHHDLQGRLIQKVYANGTTVNYVWEIDMSRLRTRIDAQNQETTYTHNIDNTPFEIGYTNTINPTATVRYLWDPHFSRVTSILKNDWGTLTYGYNPYITDPFGPPTTGGGMLASVTNNVIPNSDITYGYDALGRTTNRSINGASNAITWAYDAMSRIISEVNALGTFNYAYVDDTPGSSKGVLRLASIGYPNGQTTTFDWFDNVGDQRLKEIHNKKPGGQTLSKFNYGYNPAGEITKWIQKQKGEAQHYKLGYDLAGQLISAQSSMGNPVPPYVNQTFYDYDSASNRIAVQQKVGDAARITGTPTLDDKVRIVVTDPALPSGEKTIVHSVQAADTINDIAIKLARKITDDPDMIAIGVNAYPLTAPTSPSTVGAQISLRSASGNLTTFKGTKSSGATEEIDTSIVFNGVHNARIGGTITAGDVLTLTVKDAGLAGGQESVAHTVLATDTTKTIATAFAAAINANANLQAIGVTAKPHSNFVSIQSLSLKATTYEKSLSPGATETIGLSACINGTQTAVFGGTITAGDQLTITVFDSGINTGSEALTHTVLATDTPNTIATAFRNAINSNTKLQNEGITATSSAGVLNISSNSVKLTSYTASTSPGATETVTLAQAMNVTQYAHNNVNELTSHTGGGSVRFQGTTNKAVKSASVNATPMNLDTTKDFSGNAVLPAGANNVSVSAVDGGNNTKTNQYQISVKGGSSAGLTYDLNGNMTSDGIRSFAWDGENRLVTINYPGTNNFTSFVYDGLSRNVKIEETESGTVTSTRQFVWCGDVRSEERDSAGSLAKKYFGNGQVNASTSYFYSLDHLDSIREMTDGSGAIQGQFNFDAYGRPTKIAGTIESDFQYARYFSHGRSGLYLPVFRPYSSQLAKWLGRDPIEENGGINLYSYSLNSPIGFSDPLGLQDRSFSPNPDLGVSRNPWEVNCIGYACGLGASLEPLPGQSYSQFFSVIGVNCNPITKCGFACKCDEGHPFIFVMYAPGYPPLLSPLSDPSFSTNPYIHALVPDDTGGFSEVLGSHKIGSEESKPHPPTFDPSIYNAEGYRRYCCCSPRPPRAK